MPFPSLFRNLHGGRLIVEPRSDSMAGATGAVDVCIQTDRYTVVGAASHPADRDGLYAAAAVASVVLGEDEAQVVAALIELFVAAECRGWLVTRDRVTWDTYGLALVDGERRIIWSVAPAEDEV